MDLRDIAATAYRDVGTTDRRDGHLSAQLGKAHVFDETFGANSAFNAEVLVAALHAVAMEFDLFGERRSGHCEIRLRDQPAILAT